MQFATRVQPDQPVVLAPGQMSRVPAGAATPSPPEDVVVERMLAWRSGGFYFNNKPLGIILAEVERRYGFRLHS